MASNLTGQVRNIAELHAIAKRRPFPQITVECGGGFSSAHETLNNMVDQINPLCWPKEVTRVAREVEPRVGSAGQANVQGVAGTWKILTGLESTRWPEI